MLGVGVTARIPPDGGGLGGSRVIGTVEPWGWTTGTAPAAMGWGTRATAPCRTSPSARAISCNAAEGSPLRAARSPSAPWASSSSPRVAPHTGSAHPGARPPMARSVAKVGIEAPAATRACGARSTAGGAAARVRGVGRCAWEGRFMVAPTGHPGRAPSWTVSRSVSMARWRETTPAPRHGTRCGPTPPVTTAGCRRETTRCQGEWAARRACPRA